MFSFYKKYARTAFDITLIILTALLIMWVFSFLYSIAAPIFLAFVIFWCIEPLARFLHRRKIKKVIATAISILIFVTLILGMIIGAGIIFVSQIDVLISKIPSYAISTQDEIMDIIQDVQAHINALPPEVIDKIGEYASNIAEQFGKLAAWFLSWLVSFMTSFSTFIVNVVIGIILAFFLSVEIDFWRKVANEKTPKTFKKAFMFLKENVLKGISTYIKAQLKLISITFIIIFISLLVLQVDHAFSIAILAAFFDLLPLLGVSTIFVPWIVYLFIVGNHTLAFWLIGVFVLVILVRQILEPKITGDSLGVSAFTMLSFMIISLSLFGVMGLILSPILIILIKALYDQGYLKQWIHLPEDEYENNENQIK